MVRALWERYPGVRCIFVRRTRRSITQSFCPDFESIVLQHDPRIRKGAAASTRGEYKHPNGSVLVLAGMDDRGKVYSTNWDVVIFEEARQFLKLDIDDAAYGTLRQFTPGMPMQLLIMLTNPDAPTHHLLRRAKEGQCKRLRSYHKDNPKWWDRVRAEWTPQGKAYTDGLKKLPGVLYDRNYLGLWKAAEGAVWACWDPEVHITLKRPDPKNVWRWAAMDWGYTDPCALLVGEKDENGKVTICREVYRQKMGIEWWAQEVIAARRDLDIKGLVVDPSRPEIIDFFNRKIAQTFGASDVPFSWPAENTRGTSPGGDLAGLDLVRHYFEKGKLHLWRDRLRHWPDPELEAAELPCSLADEIGMYVYWRPREAQDNEYAFRDRTDPACADHACDALRYLITFMDKHNFGPVKAPIITELEPEHIAILKAMGQWPPKTAAAWRRAA